MFRVENWQYEYIDMDLLQDNTELAAEENLKYETIILPYKSDSSERSRLRLRHGRLTMEQNGKLKIVFFKFFYQIYFFLFKVNVGFTNNHCDSDGISLKNVSSTTSAPWKREDDKFLLTSFQKLGGDVQKTIEQFLEFSKNNKSDLEISRRLTFLIKMLNQVQST